MPAVMLSNDEEIDKPDEDGIYEEKEDNSVLDKSGDRKMPAAKLSNEEEIDEAAEDNIDEKIDENLGPNKSDDIFWPDITKGVEGIMYNVFQVKLPLISTIISIYPIYLVVDRTKLQIITRLGQIN